MLGGCALRHPFTISINQSVSKLADFFVPRVYPVQLKTPNGNDWFYIFSYRHSKSQFTKKLDTILNKHPKNGRRDAYFGFGLGCIYAVAKDMRTKN